MSKQTRLDDDALIYQPRKEQTEREKLKDMPFRKKIEYLSEYYKFHALVTVVAIILIAYTANTILNPPSSTRFYAAMISSPVDQKLLAEYTSGFEKYLNLNPKKEKIELSNNYNFSMKDSLSMDLEQALITRVSAKQVDVIIAPESYFKKYASAGSFLKLSDQLPTDIYSSLTDQFYITHTDEDKDQTAYGIYMNNTELYKNITKNSDPFVLGIVANSKHVDNSIEFVRYVFRKK